MTRKGFMPELPEVETIRLGLQKYLVGHKIVAVDVRLRKMVTGDTQHVIGSKITGVRRFGKGLVIDLDNNYSIAIHIKLTGQLIYQDEKVSKVSKVSKGKVGMVPNKFTHVIFKLKADSGLARMTDAMLYYNDFRQFGWIKIVKSDKLQEESFFGGLGAEFLKDLTLEKFKTILSKSKLAIKVLIMDQKKMSGVGNIYANDSLNLAKIDPRKQAQKLSNEEIKKLFRAIETVLKRGLKYGGASELSYVNALGGEGKYQEHFIVYGRDGKPCKNCGTTLKKIKLGGRGTYFCPNCQK